MTKRTLPPPEIPEQPLDESHLAALAERALRAALRELAALPVETHERQVHVLLPNGSETRLLPGPDYHKVIWSEAQRLSELPETRQLTDYLWDRGAFRKHFTRDDNGEIPRSAWERAVWGELIHSPILWLLNDASSEDLVTTGTYHVWRTDEALLHSAAKGTAQRCLRRARTVRAQCLIFLNDLDTEELIELEPGLALKKLTNLEHCIHLTKYSQEYAYDELWSAFYRTCVFITATAAEYSDHAAAVEIADALDRLKWALALASQRDFAVGEGPAMMRTLDGYRSPTLRRDTPLIHRRRDYTSAKLTADECTRAAGILREYRDALQIAPALGKAMWLFGRACTAGLARDSLLDAVIGLDSLLVPGGGEGRYRIALHGSALLTRHDPEAAFEQLQMIYDLRSRAAHSASAEDEKFKELAPVARMYLAGVIYVIATLINSKAIANPGDGIARGVERWVRGRLAEGARAALQDQLPN